MNKEDLQYYINDPSRIEALIDDYEKNEKQWNEFVIKIYSLAKHIFLETKYYESTQPCAAKLVKVLYNYIKVNIEPYKDWKGETIDCTPTVDNLKNGLEKLRLMKG